MKFVLRFLRNLLLLVLILFIAPALVSQGWWQYQGGHARSWNSANWSSAGILPAANASQDAEVYVMSAKTGRWKGGFSVHSWLVTKEKGSSNYIRYDKVGWGYPIRQNAWDADANWYSNRPEIIHAIRGEQAEKIIPRIEQAIQSYRYQSRGDYKVWPGPNSNTFIAHVLDAVPELGFTTTANAVGRDYLGDDEYIRWDPDGMNLQVSFKGIAGFSIGKRHGFELNFLGLVTGFDFLDPAIKLPGFGRIDLGI